MKLLTIHSDFIEFEAKTKAIPQAEETDKGLRRYEECLVVFIAAEKGDEADSDKVLEDAAKGIMNVGEQLGVRDIVLYPYVHLSQNPAPASFAKSMLIKLEEHLQGKQYNVHHAPFGWYKAFKISAKGHPLSELSKQITVKESDAPGKKPEEVYNYKELLRSISKTRLDLRELKPNDHRIIGQKLDLFSFNETAPGMVFFHHNGLIIYNELVNFWREEHVKAGYTEVSTPQILDKKLWQISGHWEKYKENIFLTSYENREFAVKPMNCPGGLLVYKIRPKSYRDLPMRVAELGIVHRQELSGVLGGLFRVIKFTQDDAHIYCTEDQIESEIEKIIELIDRFFKKFGLEFDHVELSTRPEKRMGDEKIWDLAEATLEKVLKKRKMSYRINPGDGVFYGPKIDFHVKDSLGRTWQCSTIQLDFQMPERFELEYTDNNDKQKRPIMIHRVIYGSLERFMGVLLEHTSGNLPVWLSPTQVRVISFTDRNIAASEKVVEQFRNINIRVDQDFTSSTVNDKVRNAELMKIPYIIVIGDKEEANNTVAVRQRGSKPSFGVKLDDLINEISEKIKKRL
ncbi:MAG: threonine--tRNA ligase [Candidatus Aenigmatarchaeota archaeon]